MTDYDGTTYVAVYDQFKVISIIKSINSCHVENLIVSRAENNLFCSPHRSVQGKIMSSQLVGSTLPSQH